jgi:hypothetical protein
MNTRNLPEGTVHRPELKADNLTANGEPIVYKMYEPDGSKSYGPPQHITGKYLPFLHLRISHSLLTFEI